MSSLSAAGDVRCEARLYLTLSGSIQQDNFLPRLPHYTSQGREIKTSFPRNQTLRRAPWLSLRGRAGDFNCLTFQHSSWHSGYTLYKLTTIPAMSAMYLQQSNEKSSLKLIQLIDWLIKGISSAGPADWSYHQENASSVLSRHKPVGSVMVRRPLTFVLSNISRYFAEISFLIEHLTIYTVITGERGEERALCPVFPQWPVPWAGQALLSHPQLADGMWLCRCGQWYRQQDGWHYLCLATWPHPTSVFSLKSLEQILLLITDSSNVLSRESPEINNCCTF